MYAGFIREIDDVGRIVIPKQLRKELDILEPGSKIEFFCDGTQLICKKATEDCCFCKSKDDLIEFEGKYICNACIAKLKGE